MASREAKRMAEMKRMCKDQETLRNGWSGANPTLNSRKG